AHPRRHRSRAKDRRRLRLLRQRERHHQRRHLGDALDIEDDTRAMRRVERQPDQGGGGIKITLGVKRAIGQFLLPLSLRWIGAVPPSRRTPSGCSLYLSFIAASG